MRPSDESLQAWEQLRKASGQFDAALRAFLRPEIDRVAVIRYNLEQRLHVDTTLYNIAQYMPSAELFQLFDHLVSRAMTEGSFQAFQKIIVGLPREEVLARIEAEAEPWLEESADYEILFHLYVQLDNALTDRLVQKALNSPDPDIRRYGQILADDLREYGYHPNVHIRPKRP